jgi:hypothetical protein
MNPFGVDDRLIGGSPFAIEERSDPPIAISWPLIHQPANGGQKLRILGLVVGDATGSTPFQARTIQNS